MSVLDPLRRLADWLASMNALQRRLAQFNCGDCPRRESCGQPPREDCLVRRGEIASGEWRARRRPPIATGW